MTIYSSQQKEGLIHPKTTTHNPEMQAQQGNPTRRMTAAEIVIVIISIATITMARQAAVMPAVIAAINALISITARFSARH
jgi:hypothetical protein